MNDSTQIILNPGGMRQDMLFVCDVDSVTSTSVSPSKPEPPGPWLQMTLPLIVALLIVFIEKWLTQVVDGNNARRKRLETRHMILNWIDLILPTEINMAKSLAELSKNIIESDEMLAVPFRLPQTIPNKINDFPIDVLTAAFLQDNKTKDDMKERNDCFYNIVSNIQYLTKLQDNILETYEKYNRQAWEICKEWNVRYMEFVDKFNDSIYGRDYDKIIIAWNEEQRNKPNSPSVHLKYLNRLFEDADNKYDTTMVADLNRLIVIQKQSISLNEGYSKLFSEINKNIIKVIEILQESSEFFKD